MSAVYFEHVTAGESINVVVQQLTRRCDKPLPTPREAPQAPPHFTGRENLISKLKGALLGDTDGRTVALYGMGGAGKTTLAAMVAQLPEVEKNFSEGTFWIDLQATNAMAALDHIACTFGNDISGRNNTDSRAAAVRSILRDKSVLIVLDNAWQIEEIAPLLPNSLRTRTIVTTRDENLANDISDEVVPITTLSEGEGVEFLKKLFGKTADDESSSACREITILLGHLPLALELAGKQIRKEARKTWFSWPDFVSSLKREDGRLDLGSKDKSVRTTFNISYARGLDEPGRTLFNWLGLFGPVDLELGAIARVAELDEHSAGQILGVLTDLSLVQQTDSKKYYLHPLLHDFAREKFAELEESSRVGGYQRACDYFYERAQQECKDPKSMDDVGTILRSHHYAAAARDKERARRVYPWFGDVPLPGFLKQHGYPYTLVEIDEAERA